MRGMELWRPDWATIMEGCVFNNPNASELVQITEETARLALGLIKRQCEQDYYHNYGAALQELRTVLELADKQRATPPNA